MVEATKGQSYQTFDSFYNKSSLYLLYGGMRKKLFVNKHPVNGISSKHVGLQIGKSFLDLNEQQLEYKEGGWRVKANFGGTNLFNLKMKIGTKTKGLPRNNVQFGTDESHFGSGNKQTKYSVGGMFNFNIGGVLVASRLKVFSDETVEVFADAELAGAIVGCDLRAAPGGTFGGFLGASYGIPNSSFPVLKNVHLGGVLSLDDMRPSVGVFGEMVVPSVEKAIVGVELFDKPRAALVGAELALDNENTVVAKAGDNGIAHVSWIKHFKGIELRMGVEANVAQASVGKFGARVTIKQ